MACVLAGGLVAGTLDIVYAASFWNLTADVPGLRILQSVAAGLLGSSAYEGGLRTASLGLFLHFVIAVSMAVAWYGVARRWSPARNYPLRAGAAYGLFLYLVMNFVVVPLSAAGPGSSDPVWVGLTVAVHILFVGIPIALFVRRAIGPSRHQPAIQAPEK